jgi:hypothetical protein
MSHTPPRAVPHSISEDADMGAGSVLHSRWEAGYHVAKDEGIRDPEVGNEGGDPGRDRPHPRPDQGEREEGAREGEAKGAAEHHGFYDGRFNAPLSCVARRCVAHFSTLELQSAFRANQQEQEKLQAQTELQGLEDESIDDLDEEL